MKLVLDQTACQGYGLCSQEAPDLVDLDDWGYAGLTGDGTIPTDRKVVAQLAASVCPVAALRIEP
jgi:ferredoxin